MKSIKHLLAPALLASLLATSAFAMDRETLRQKYTETKTAGLVGEQPNGYLGIIKNQGDAAAVVESMNKFRKNRYQQVAKENGLPLSEVENRAGQRLYDKAEPGDYLLINGKWTKK